MLDPHTVRRISVESFRDPRTVLACYSGGKVSALALASVTAAAVRLGLPPPGTVHVPPNAKGAQPAKQERPSPESEHGESTI